MSVLESLMRHVAADGLEAHHLRQMIAFASAHGWPFDRAIREGHLTGSAVIVSADGARVLLVYHRKLACWLQPGGHAEPGESEGEAVALREAREETGIDGLELHAAAPRPIDVDVHRIPAHGDDPAHDHLDLRYFVIAPPGSEPDPCIVETRGARWFTWDELDEVHPDLPMRRMLAKARDWATTPRPSQPATGDAT